MAYNLTDATGGSAAILGDLLVHPQFNKSMDVRIAMSLCRQIAEKRAQAFVYDNLEPQIREAYDMYVMTNGEQFDAPLPMEWDEGMDDVIEHLLEPMERCFTADWLGNAVVDTRLHKPPAKAGDPDAIEALARSAAKDAWRVMIDSRDFTDGAARELTTNKILSACGIVEGDVQQFLSTTPPPTAQAVTAAKEARMSDIREIMNTIHAKCGGVFDPTAYEALFENAIDDDDGIAASGATQLGASADDVEAFRMFAMECTDSPAEALVDLLGNAPFDLDAPDETGGVTAGAGFVPPAPGGSASAPRPVPSAPAATAKLPKPVAVGGIPPQAFQALKESLKVKDEDIATALGISRQTYINYGKPNAKVVFVPSDAQRTYLLDLLQDHINALSAARNEIEGI